MTGAAVHVLYFIDSLVPAGAERSLAALAPRYAARGVDLHVVYLHDRPGLHADLEAAGAHLRSIAGDGGRIGWLRRGTQAVRRERPDLVHTTLAEADLVGRVAGALTRTPVVSSLVNIAYGPEQLDDPKLRPWKVRAAQLADATTARLVTRFHANSANVATVMGRRLRIPADRIDVVPRGRDPQELGTKTATRRTRTREALEINGGDPLIVAAARQEFQKGLDVLLDALPAVVRDVPRTRLVVAGRDGNQSTLLRDQIERLGLTRSVSLLGPRTDVPDLLCAADAFVAPSRWEGFPGAVLEATALEAPIVASDLPGVREVVGDATAAWLVPSEQPEALARALTEALGDPLEARRRTDTARRRFLEHFTIDSVADRMVALYQRSLAGR